MLSAIWEAIRDCFGLLMGFFQWLKYFLGGGWRDYWRTFIDWLGGLWDAWVVPLFELLEMDGLISDATAFLDMGQWAEYVGLASWFFPIYPCLAMLMTVITGQGLIRLIRWLLGSPFIWWG